MGNTTGPAWPGCNLSVPVLCAQGYDVAVRFRRACRSLSSSSRAVTVIETILASIVLAICVLLLVRMWVSPRVRDRMDAIGRRCRRAGERVLAACWREPLARRHAARAANEAIRRARRRSAHGTPPAGADGKESDSFNGEREGNVYKPKSFRRPHKPH
jgi:hypothetical protein